jgi:hypothetical protein
MTREPHLESGVWECTRQIRTAPEDPACARPERRQRVYGPMRWLGVISFGLVAAACSGNTAVDSRPPTPSAGTGGNTSGGTRTTSNPTDAAVWHTSGGVGSSTIASNATSYDCDPSLCECVNGRINVVCDSGRHCGAPAGMYYDLGGGNCTTQCPFDPNLVNPADYAGPCSVDTDCTDVSSLCAPCVNAVVAASRAAAYTAAVTAVWNAAPPGGDCVGPMPFVGLPQCQSGTCVGPGSSSSSSSTSSSSGGVCDSGLSCPP